VRDGGGSILRHGDLSVLSFHATKVFNTFEGGAIVCPDAKTKQRVDHLKNFGFVDETTVVAPGINGKMSEFGAALGILQLKHFEEALNARKEIDSAYRERLAGVTGITCLSRPPRIDSNYAYFPILVEANYPIARDDLYALLKRNDIHPRRYFYPLISNFPMYRSLPSAGRENLAAATSVAQKILCLPIYPDLDESDVDRISKLIIAQRQ
jgi:dTDP-4-amino-4,6-dideoxygalactose transaminase